MKLYTFILVVVTAMATILATSEAYVCRHVPSLVRESQIMLAKRTARKISDNEVQNKKISNDRRRKLGIADDEDEYDLDIALDNSTDPFITKVVAGSLILTILALLVAGIIIPATTDYGDGVCNPLLTGGRC